MEVHIACHEVLAPGARVDVAALRGLALSLALELAVLRIEVTHALALGQACHCGGCLAQISLLVLHFSEVVLTLRDRQILLLIYRFERGDARLTLGHHISL